MPSENSGYKDQTPQNSRQVDTWIAENAARQVAEIYKTVNESYAESMKQQMQLGAGSQAQYNAIQMQQQLTTSQSVNSGAFIGTGAAIGFAAGGFAGAPVGAMFGGLAGSAYNSYYAGQQQIAIQQQLSQGQLAQAASQASFFAGTGFGGGMGMQNAFGYLHHPASEALALQAFSPFAANPYSNVGADNGQWLYRQTMSNLMPYGDPQLFATRAAGFAGLQAQSFSSYGLSPQQFFGSSYNGAPIGGNIGQVQFEPRPVFEGRVRDEWNTMVKRDDWLSINAGIRAARNGGADIPYASNSDSQMPATWEDFRDHTPDKAKDYAYSYLQKKYGKRTFEQGVTNTAYAFDRGYIFGDKGYEAIQRAGASTEALGAAGRGIEAMQKEQADEGFFFSRSSAFQSEAGQAQYGDFFSVSGLLGKASDDAIAGAASLRKRYVNLSKVAFDENGSVRKGFEKEAAMAMDTYSRYQSAVAGSASIQNQALFANNSAVNVGIAGQTLSGQLDMNIGGMYGDTHQIRAGATNVMAGSQADAGQALSLINSGGLNPQQLVEQFSRLSQAIERNEQAFQRSAVAVNRIGEMADSTGTRGASATFSIGAMRGSSGGQFSGDAEKVMGRMDTQIGNLQSRYNTYANALLERGRDPQTDPEANRMMNDLYGLQMGREQFERQTAISPLAVGTRRSMASTDFALDILGTMPGAVGAMRQGYAQGIEGIGKARSEMEANRADKMKQGKWVDGKWESKWREVDEEKFEEQMHGLGRKEAGYRSQLIEGWESRLTSTVINAPGMMDFVSPDMAYGVAVGRGGLHGARFGSNKDQQGRYMREAMAIGSIAGNTSTSDGFYATAMTGARHGEHSGTAGGRHSMEGMTMRVVIEDMGEDGRTRYRNGSAHFTQSGDGGNTVETLSNLRPTNSKY